MSDFFPRERFREILPRLWTFAIRIARNQVDAASLVERAFASALKVTDQWESQNSAISFMFSDICAMWMTERYCGNNLRIQDGDPAKKNSSKNTLKDKDVTPGKTLLEGIPSAINALSEMQRIVMILVGAEGYLCAQVAELLNLPVHYVAHRILDAGSTMSKLFEHDKAHRLIHET